MSSWSWASSATTQCTPHTTDNLRPVARLGVIATTGGFGRSRATRIAVEPDEVQQMIADRFQRLGDLPRGIRDRVAGGIFGLRPLRRHHRAIDRIALHFLADAVHGRDRLDRIFAGGGLRRQHDRVGAFIHGGGDVGDFRARRHRRLDHRFQHLGRHHHRLAGAARHPRHLLLQARHPLQRQFDAEIATRHHQRVGDLDDLAAAGRSPAAFRSSPSPPRGRGSSAWPR